MTVIHHEFAGASSAEIAPDMRPAAGRTGAEILGIDLGRDAGDAATLAPIRAALLRCTVIFFRGQGALDDAVHGVKQAGSQRIFNALQEHATVAEHTVRRRPGDVAIRDNRAMQHRAVADLGKKPRHLRRATIARDVPVGLDGQRSRPIKSEPAERAAAA